MDGKERSWRRSLQRTISTSRLSGLTGGPTVPRRGYGRLSLTTLLYVRAYNGQKSRWYQAALRQKAGRITAAGITICVTFEPVDGPVNDRIDDAYRAKYKSSPYLAPMIGSRARAASVRVVRQNATKERLNGCLMSS